MTLLITDAIDATVLTWMNEDFFSTNNLNLHQLVLINSGWGRLFLFLKRQSYLDSVEVFSRTQEKPVIRSYSKELRVLF